MGADIYLMSAYEPIRQRWQPVFDAAVRERDRTKDEFKRLIAQKAINDAYNAMYSAEGYFRDNYNEYGLFAQLGLSWWSDVLGLLDKGLLPICSAKHLRQHVAATPLDISPARLIAQKQGDPAPTEAEYERMRSDLLALLDQSIRLNEPLRCSL